MLAGSKLKPIFIIFVLVSFGLAFVLFLYLNNNSSYPTKKQLLRPNGYNVLGKIYEQKKIKNNSI